MPLVTTIAINEKQLHKIFVGRMETLDSGSIIYSVLAREVEQNVLKSSLEDQFGGIDFCDLEPDYIEYMLEGVKFEHNPEDGAMVCVSKALNSWIEKHSMVKNNTSAV